MIGGGSMCRVLCPDWSVISDSFPFRTNSIEGTEDVNRAGVADVKDMIYPCTVVKLVTPCDERFPNVLRYEFRTVDEVIVLAPAFNSALASGVSIVPTGV